MNGRLLLAGAVLIAVVAVAGALLAPDVLATPRDQPDRPGLMDIEEVTVSPGEVTGDSVTLGVDSYLTHRGGPASNVTVVVRAVDAETGFLRTTERIDVGTVTDEGEVRTSADLLVERSGGYRLEVLLYEDGKRIEQGTTTVGGLDSLTPAYARTDVEFHRFEEGTVPAIEFAIAEVGENRTTLAVSTYLTNQGDPSADLELVLTARQAESNIVADRSRIQIGEIGAGRTVSPETELSVPNGYNYYLDAVLWKDGVVVGSSRAAANLDPTRTISVNETTEDVGLEVSEFQREEREPPEGEPEPPETETTQPGFGITVAVAALIGATLVARRWAHE